MVSKFRGKYTPEFRDTAVREVTGQVPPRFQSKTPNITTTSEHPYSKPCAKGNSEHDALRGAVDDDLELDTRCEDFGFADDSAGYAG